MENINAQAGNENAQMPSQEELLKQLDTLNLSISMLYVVILALFLNLHYIYWEKARLLDAINGTNCSELLPDYTDAPRIAAKLFLFATGVFLGINIDNLNTQLAVEGSRRDETEIRRAETRVISSFLTFIASGLNHNNLNL